MSNVQRPMSRPHATACVTGVLVEFPPRAQVYIVGKEGELAARAVVLTADPSSPVLKEAGCSGGGYIALRNISVLNPVASAALEVAPFRAASSRGAGRPAKLRLSEAGEEAILPRIYVRRRFPGILLCMGGVRYYERLWYYGCCLPK